MIKKTVIFLLEIFAFISAYEINLEDNGPIVLDGTIRFTVAVYDENGLVKDNIKFEWEDDAYPQHIRKTDIINNGTDIWEITYNASIYRPRIYIAKVTLLKCFFICYQVGSASIAYNVTESINGHMLLQQNNKTISNGYVSTKEEVIHVLDIYKTDMDFIKTATTIRTYWFVDCTYYGISNELRFPFNFTTANQDHLVEALVMADFTPPPPTTTLPPSTTTSTTAIPNTTTTTTTTKLPVTTKTTTITISPTSTTASIITDLNISSTLPSTTTKSLKKAKRDVEGTTLPHVTGVTIWNNGSLIPYNKSFPFVCNSSFLSTDSHKSYGYFYKKFQTKGKSFKSVPSFRTTNLCKY